MYRDGMMQALDPITFDPNATGSPIIEETGLKYDGSFSRGLSLGNRQDLVLNSNFDLRMAGPLGDDIEILAALSDNSIPLQPEGNTQQLQEFDKIFIQLSKGRNVLIGGDFEMKRPASHFMNYFKRTQGARFATAISLGENKTLSTAVAIAGSKGKFARINIDGVEGNQGPYRLPGTDGERFIIVLAGSEKIYVDGKLLLRGLEKDYTIDYNAGEVFFTPNQLITKDKRIIAEYEYSVQSYNRSIYTGEIDYQAKGYGLHFNAYSEQDGILSAGLLNLTTEDKRFLADLGDNIESSFSSSIRRRDEGFDPNIVMYALIDSLGFDRVLVRSSDPEVALYTARFTFVGQNQGDYIQVASESNGEVYAWLEPDPVSGPRGTHSPVQQLVTPRQRQMYTFGGHVDLGKQGVFRSEVSATKNDLNRFSDGDSGDDVGFAINNRLDKSFTLKKKEDAPDLIFATSFMHEFVQQDFRALNPYRAAEFSRDWNLRDIDQDDEHLMFASIALRQGSNKELSYQYSGLFRKNLYDGNKHLITARFENPGFAIKAIFNHLSSEDQFRSSTFQRPIVDISKSFGTARNWTLGAYFEEEKNSVRNLDQGDTLSLSSFYYDLGKIYLRKEQGKKLNLEMSYQKRWDYRARNTQYGLATLADDFSIGGRWAEGVTSILDGTLTVRNLSILDPERQTAEAGLNYLGRITHQLNIGEGLLRTNTTYQVSSGQEPKRTFQYLKVDPGLGVYTFIDVNGDGIQQVNVFAIAAFQEQAEYVRVTILTNEFIPTNNITFNQSYSLDPRKALTNKDGILAKFSDQGSIRIDRKNLQNSSASLWNPFELSIADSSLISVSSQIRNVFYFNRTNPRYDFQWEWEDFRNRIILTTGFESKGLARHTLRSRINFKKSWSTILSFSREINVQDSESFDAKDFQIEGYEIKPEITWQPSTKFRLNGKYRRVDKTNVLEDGGQQAMINDVNLESVWNQASTSALRFNVSLVLIDFSGNPNPSLEFTMLEGLKNGTNWIWGLSYDRRLANNIRINISYDGRKSETAKVVHTARAQVSAFF